MVGALRVRNDAGQVFLLGSGLKDAQRRSRPVGTRVTYSWRGLTARGCPFATLLRVREPASEWPAQPWGIVRP
jgi:DNA ligase-1